MDIAHKTYWGGKKPQIGDLVYDPRYKTYGVCVSLFGERCWAKIKWIDSDCPIVRPIYNYILIKRSCNER